MGGGASGDLMHFDFNVHDPGTPADPNLAAWRSLQEERRLARTAHAKVAKVTAADLAQTITDLSNRLSATSPGCVGKISDKVSSIEQTNGQEYDAIFGADVTDGPSAQPHRQAIEALLAPAQQAKTNATSGQKTASSLDTQALAAARDTKGIHSQSISNQLGETKASVGRLEGQIQ
jgi:hypothetical protein